MPLITEQELWPRQSIRSSDVYGSGAYRAHCSSSDNAPLYYSPHLSFESNAAVTDRQEENARGVQCQERALTPTSTTASGSNTSSTDDFHNDLLAFRFPEYDFQHVDPCVVAATPSEFADHFPSLRKLSIKHDDTTDDGNMNLRIDTAISSSARGYYDLTLFHLRMYDLKDRDFSFRRYCRDSGKEICHSRRKYTKTSTTRRPMLQRSISNALSNLRSTLNSPKCEDSSYKQSSDSEDEGELDFPLRCAAENGIAKPSNTIAFEFSNYAHLEVRQRRARSPKYDFLYWGRKYSWKRASFRNGNFNMISYHLVDLSSHTSVAHIVPVPLSDAEARDEEAKGG